MNDHQQITAERGRRAADLRAAAVALLEQQAIASGVMLDLDSDQVVAAGPKSAILYLLSNGASAATSGDAPDLQQLKALALAATPGEWMRLFGERTVYDRMEDGCRGNIIVRADYPFNQQDAANLDYIAAANPAVVLGLIAQVESLYNAMRLWKQKAEGVARIESAAAPALVEKKAYGPDNPPRLRKDGESVRDYRIAMGWDAPPAAAPAIASGDELAKWHEPSWQKGYSAGYNDAVGDVRAPSTSTSPAERAASSAGGPGDGAPKFPEPGYSNSLADRVFNLPCNWKGDQALHSAILMGHTMACEQAYNLVMADEQARAAVSAATKPTAELPRPNDDELWDATLRDRDTYHEWADKLAEAISKHFDAYIGEHSNANCPWAEALEVIEGYEDEKPAHFAALLPGPYYMDPPDGGSVSILEQIKRMAEDATQWRSLLATKPAAVPEGWRRALHAAVCAIYFDDSADFRSSLGAVVRHLDAELAGELLGNPKAAYDKACAMLEATPAASTTGAAQTAEQVRDQALEEAAKAAESTRVAQVQHGLSLFQDGNGTRKDIATAIRALKRPTPTHSSEAGDAQPIKDEGTK